MSKRKTIEIECLNCKQKKVKDLIRYTYERKQGGNSGLFCSSKCVGSFSKKKEIVIPCGYCNREFPSSEKARASKFCSRDCASAGSVTDLRRDRARESSINNFFDGELPIKIELTERTCEWCDKSFLPTVKKQITCSRSCGTSYGNFKKAKNSDVLLSCLNCHEEFHCPFNKRNERKFCKFECSTKYRYPNPKSKNDKDLADYNVNDLSVCKNCSVEFFHIRKRVYCNDFCFRNHQSKTMCERISSGTHKTGRAKKYKYISPISGEMTVDGTWELKFCEWADSEGLKIQRVKSGFSYHKKENIIAKYYPDFYINYQDVEFYVEIKGFETELDRVKWEQFPRNLVVLKKEEITKLKFSTILDLIYLIRFPNVYYKIFQ